VVLGGQLSGAEPGKLDTDLLSKRSPENAQRSAS
jgi:hypothetical protein